MNLKDAFRTFQATKETEPDLENYFVETDAIKKLQNSNEICVVSGLKGIGKTATYRKLAEFESEIDLTIDISSESYSLNLPHAKLRAINYSHEFEFEITIEFLKKITENEVLIEKIDSKLISAAKKHVKSFMEILKKLGGRVTGVSILGCGLNLSDPKSKVLTGLQGRENEINAKETLKAICDSGIKLRLVIDDPEEVFFSDQDLNLPLLGGLWLAIARMNLLSKNFRSFLMLKTHIHDYVFHNTPDLDKYPNSVINICWEENALKNLIKRRMVHFLNINQENWEEILWGESLNKKDKEKRYLFIFSNLRNGPRELLTWLFYALETNENKGINNLTIESLELTLKKLSKNAFKYFNSSHGEEFQDIGSLVQIVFEELEDKEFSKKEMTSRIKDLKKNNEDFQTLEKKHTWIQSTVSKAFSEIFFRVGAINICSKNSIYPYMCEYNTDNFELTEKFKLTPIFKNYLNS